MYSHPGGGGRPGSKGGGGPNSRYVKGRLPEGVDFAAYPGRSSTPLPTAESKSAERINQLKIWNEAATNVGTPKAKVGANGGGNFNSNRRTDSFKDAKDRHSASFQDDVPGANGKHSTTTRVDIYANASSDEDDKDDGDESKSYEHDPAPNNNITNATAAATMATQPGENTMPTQPVERKYAAGPNNTAPAIVPASTADAPPAATSRPPPGAAKEKKGCCVVQ